MQAIGEEERKELNCLSSFHPQPLPDDVSQCPPPDGTQDVESDDLDPQRFLPCHYFDIICGSSTGRCAFPQEGVLHS
jgi:hypothetical protein